MASSSAGKGPRQHHYVFGHLALRDISHHDPHRFIEVLTGGEADRFLLAVWRDVAKAIGDDPPVPHTGLASTVKTLGNGDRLAVVTLPGPVAMTEAYFVGVVVPPPPSTHLRYFTLELSFSLDGGKTALLCEWELQEKGFRHVNYGPGPEPDQASFVEAIEGHLKDRPPSAEDN
jgi:hypothetical protein